MWVARDSGSVLPMGEAAASGRDGGFVEMPVVPGEPRINLLLPNGAASKALFKAWDKELARLRAKESDGPVPPVLVSMDIDIVTTSSAPTGRSSITLSSSYNMGQWRR